MDIVKRLSQLENERSSMIPSHEQREDWDILVEKLVKDAISNKETGPAFRLLPDGEKIIDEDFTLRSSPRDMETTLQQISDKIVSFGVQMGNPNNMSYIPGSESYLTALGDYLGAVINPYTGVAITNPGATAMQQSLLKWAGGFLGYTGDFGGDITSGGSIANLTAIITARDAFQIQPEDIRQSTVYYSAHAHHSVTKALHLAGMQYCQQRSISCYEDFAINLEELEKTIAEDKKAGLKPWLLVGNAGTTDTGTVDDLNGMADIAEKYLNDPVRVSVSKSSTPAPNIKQDTIKVSDGEKYTSLLTSLEERDGSIIVFVKTKRGTEKMAKRLQKEGHSAEAIHGDLKQSKRDRVIASFRKMKYRILVATDVAARGLDIPHIEHVINYDLPQCAEDYVHRIGRTARAGATGSALSFITPADRGKWGAIDRLLNPNSKKESRSRKPSSRKPSRKRPSNAAPRGDVVQLRRDKKKKWSTSKSKKAA